MTFPESAGWRPRAVVADEQLMRARMEVRAARTPPATAPVVEEPAAQFAVPDLPWVTTPGLAGKPLSSREAEMLALIAEGATNKQAAHELGISEQTAKNHMTSILGKLHVPDRTAAVVRAAKIGIIRLPQPPATTPGLLLEFVEARLVALRGDIDAALTSLRAGRVAAPAIVAVVPGATPPARLFRPATQRSTTCSVEGCELPPSAYGGKGRPPTRCDDHRLRRAVA